MRSLKRLKISLHWRGYCTRSLIHEIKQCGIGEIGEGVTPRHKYKYVGSYDINIDGIGGDYWECTECGNIKFDEPDNI